MKKGRSSIRLRQIVLAYSLLSCSKNHHPVVGFSSAPTPSSRRCPPSLSAPRNAVGNRNSHVSNSLGQRQEQQQQELRGAGGGELLKHRRNELNNYYNGARTKNSLVRLTATRSPSLNEYSSSSSNEKDTTAAAAVGAATAAVSAAAAAVSATASPEVSWEAVIAPTKECAVFVDNETNNGHNNNNNSVVVNGPCIPPLRRPHPEITALDSVCTAAASVSVISLLVWLVIYSGDWRYYLAGGICAAVSHGIPVPVDVVKTRKQVDPTLVHHDFIRATKHIYQTEGMKGLFVGSGPTFVGYFLEGAIKFGVYEVMKPIVQGLFCASSSAAASASSSLVVPILSTPPSAISKFSAFCVSAAISGFAASIMLCPMEALRIRLVAEPEYANLGWIRGGMTIMKREGISGFAKGIVPMMYKQIPYTITKNVSFDFLTKLAYASLVVSGTATAAATATTSSIAKIVIPLTCAAIASVLSCITSQPGDMLLSLVNAHGGARRTHHVARDILRSDKGIAGFFVGIKTRFLHVGIIVTLQLLIYDVVKRACGIAATGSV